MWYDEEYMLFTSKGIHGNKDTTNVGIDVSILPAFLQILIDALITDLGQESHIGNADLFLLEALFPVRL